MFADDLAFLKSLGAREAQNVKEAEQFCDFISDVKPEVYIEIGVRHGWTFYLVSKVLSPHARMIAVDLPGVFPWGDDGSQIVFDKILSQTRPREVILVPKDSQNPETLESIKVWTPYADFIFIDADHKYEGVKKDWELYRQLVTHGYIAFHDIKAKPKDDPAKLIEVPKLWDEIKIRFKHHEIGDNPGIGILEI